MMNSIKVEHLVRNLPGSAFWGNLMLLGLKEVELSAQMFTGSSSNENGLLALLYFLLVKAKPAAKSALSGCYPTIDSSQRRDFKRVARGLLEELKREGVTKSHLIRSSTLNTAKGKPAQVLLWAFSYDLLCNAIRKENGQSECDPADLKSLARAIDGVGSSVPELLTKLREEKDKEVKGLNAVLHQTLRDRTEVDSFLANLVDEAASIEEESKRLDALIAEEERLLGEESGDSDIVALDKDVEGMREDVQLLNKNLSTSIHQINKMIAEQEHLGAPNVEDASEIPGVLQLWNKASFELSCELTRTLRDLGWESSELDDIKNLAERKNELQEHLELKYNQLQKAIKDFHLETVQQVESLKTKSKTRRQDLSSVRSLATIAP